MTVFKYLGYLLRAGYLVITNAFHIRRYAKNPEKYPSEIRYSRIHRFLSRLSISMHCDFYIEGQENIPANGNVVFVSNHQSNMDPVILVRAIDKPVSFVAKKETRSFPVVSTIIKALDSVFIDRTNIRSEIKSIGTVSQRLEEIPEQSFIIFPEGTRSRPADHPVADFKPGALKPAFTAKKPIVPVALYGGFRCLAGKLNLKRYPIQVKFLKPIMPEELENTNTVELSERIEKEIVSETDKMREKDKELVEPVLKSKKQNPFISGL